MKILYFSANYSPYIKFFLDKNLDFHLLDYKQQLQKFTSDYFGMMGSFANYANRIGAEAQLIVTNFESLQKQWAKENNFSYSEKNWAQEIAIAQIKNFKPDVFFMSSMFDYYGEFLETIRPYCKNVFGWIACPIPQNINLKQLSLILTSGPHYVDNFRKLGINSELLPAAFDNDILEKLNKSNKKDISFSFIGGLSGVHRERVEQIKILCNKTPLKVWGTGLEKKKSNLRNIFAFNTLEKRYKGESFGLDMYNILNRSKIVFNSHIAEAEEYAGNIRMYQATGTGALLLSDYKKNANDIFVDCKEAVYYHSVDDAIEKVNYYLKHEDERKKIALAGQQRTLKEHNLENNMKQMLNYFEKYS